MAGFLIISLIMGLIPFQTIEAEAKEVEKIVTYSEEAFWRNYYACYGEKENFDLIIKGPEAKKVYERLDESWDIESNLFKTYHDQNKIYQSNMVAAWSCWTLDKKISKFSPNDSKLVMHFKPERLEIFKRFKRYVDATTEIALPALKEMNLEEKNDYERIYAFSKWLAERCEYDWDFYFYSKLDGPWQKRFGDDIHGKGACGYTAVVDGKAVCEGYAGATAFLLGVMGYDVVTSYDVTVRNENHACNYVKLDGKWYALDNTWNDSENNVFKTDYFLAGADTFYLSHNVSAEDKKRYPLAETAYHGNSKIELPPVITGKAVDDFPKEDHVEFPSIKIEKKVYVVSVGNSIKPVIKIKNPNKEKITYTSSNNSVATVSSNGTIKAKKKGKVTITVRVGKNSAKKFVVKIKS